MSLGRGDVQILIEAVNRTREASQASVTDLEALRKARVDAQKFTLEEARTVSYLRREFRASHMAYYDTISVMRNVGSIGRTVLSMWNAQNIAQIRIQDSLRNVEEAQIAVNTALELYGENSVIYQQAVSDLEEMEEAANRAKGDETTGLIGLGLTAVGVAAQIGALFLKLAEYGVTVTSLMTLGAAAAAGIATVGGLGALAVAGPSTTPTPMAELAGPGALTQAEMLAGMTYEEKYAKWREGQMMTFIINQYNYGVQDAMESLNMLKDVLARLATR